ncbi:MAG: YebC/PmpR family DNA-binding transcriptional regulator [Bacteroidales bacterium]|nr:YebC/PmpR family DNA-binding transcriptional regulator [Bacteroidales bacterium]NCA75894.1 YebC/PmpR family DNA-binding transcriptional regulator [Alphaproteobacteria bacterium]HNW72174.1 YebC/PmpR family DNA-binding transcriptional regulator [Bacteroidales bacterium]HPS49353.1 YebC/PmpR family DNA-binding transcriptional regulator [Bacteroidales bacterium]
MSGHNKWSTIKRKKGALDAKRSKIFSKIIKDITIAVKEGGADPDGNPRLRLAIANAKGASMPKDNIQRAINKGTDKDAAALIETTYEGKGPQGIAIFVECTTDNLQRTVSNIRSHFNKHGGELGQNGMLNYLFDRKGVFVVPKGEIDRDEFEMELIDAGAEDITLEDDVFTIITAMEDFGSMIKKLESLKIEPESAALQRLPKNTTTLDEEATRKVLKLIDILEEDEDVQNVFHTLAISDELAERL